MRFDSNIVAAEFIKRPNRFIAHVKLNEKEIIAHVPNTGRCKELLIEGVRVILREGKTPGRKTPYDLISVFKGNTLINIDSQAPNKIVYEALFNKKIEKLKEYDQINKEKKHGNSRFDFYLKNDFNEYYLEVKGVTLEEDGVVMFPDAPTKRGAKHLRELIELKKNGIGAGVLFVVQLSGAKYFTPNKERDEEFSKALIEANEVGVDIMAYECIVKEDEVILSNEIEVRL
ncbi:DNA/RNA nuclease SfsA [Oceanirhabdus sp. W0125-5]|uniref:DNA/RNA nuclease SfsA n=1 Tax=Oceanirhabdus sp. W0125-5 TaxID=2999116 RepID=UPI0022F2DE74|nr:DNA/RNA nuclease SfsA [Oceanirhabdus sp. W0125-5]WBW99680.1 DNA/RNA nuclease SfsA [Oceanirhabdus sp. W0125-5]